MGDPRHRSKRARGQRPRAGLPAPRAAPGRSPRRGRARLLRTWGLPLLALVAAIGVGIALGVRSAGNAPGAGDRPDSAATTVDTTSTGTAPVAPTSARELFAENCGVCHTLAAAGVTAGIGPDLDQVRPTRDHVRSMIANGSLTGIMPAGLLTGDDAERVAAYVARNAGR